MKKSVTIVALVMCLLLVALAACGPTSNVKVNPDKEHYVVGICQLVTHDALDAATNGFKQALTAALEAEGRTVEFKEQNAQGDATLCSTITNQFVTDDVDLIMANATAALQAAAESTLSIPVLGTSITEYGVALNIKGFDGVVGGNVSGTSDLAPLDQQADMITNLVPNATKVALVYCSAEPNSQYQVDEVQRLLEEKGLVCKQYGFADSNEANAVVTQAANENDVIYVPTDNTVASNAEILKAISLEKRVPIVAGEEGICKGCGIATLSISYENLGKKTGEMAAKILLGKVDMTKMSIEYADAPTYKYNAELCEFFGIVPPSNYVAIPVEA